MAERAEIKGRRGSTAQLALERLYARVGSRIVFVYLAACLAASVVGSALGWSAGARLLGLSFSQAVSVYALTLPALFVFASFGAIPSLGQLRTILAWNAADSARAVAIDTWNALMGVRVIVTRAIGAGILAFIPFAIYVTLRFHEPWWGVFILFLAPACQAAALGMFLIALAELAMRPMLQDVAAHLPEDFEPEARGLRLGIKALAPLPLVTFFAAGITAAYGNIGTKGIARLSVGLGIGLGTIAIATVIYLIINRSVLAPIDDLIAATDRVRAGDMTTRVPVLSLDELGSLTRSFNEMLEDLRAARERIVTAADAERRRVERDLHDGAQQHLVLLNLKLAMAQRLIDEDPRAANALHDELRGDLNRALSELRDLAHGIYPAILESEGLLGALREAVELAAIPAELECDGAGRHRPELEAAVYFCCVEALQNASKYAGDPAHAHVRIAHRGGSLDFEVRDDGRGFDAVSARHSAGIQNMTDRIGALGGSLRIQSTPGSGTTVAGTIPLDRHG